MTWLQITITTDRHNVARAEQVLLALGASSVTLTDGADQPIFEPQPGDTPLWPQAQVTGLFAGSDAGALERQIADALADIEHNIRSEHLEDQDWSRTWMQHYQPMPFGQRLWVCPLHIEPPDAGAVNLRLDPGLAFGTGTHPTTALCLRWLDQHLHQPHRVLDYGCGSGILAIAALLLGAGQATGVDIDPQALEASASNAEINHVADRLQLLTPEQLPDSRYDIVLANILSGPLQQLAPMLAGYTVAGGDVVLSGILREQADAVRQSYSRFFDMQPALFDDDWALLHGIRNGHPVTASRAPEQP